MDRAGEETKVTTDHEALDMLREQAERLLANHATPERLKGLLEIPGAFDRDVWTQAIDLGWPAAAIAEDLGGLGLGIEALCMLTEQLGKTTVSLPLIGAAVVADALEGHAEGAKFGAALAGGELIAAIAFGENGESGIPTAPKVRFANGKLSGAKAATAFGAVADVALVHASTADGVALVLVDLRQAAVTRITIEAIDNARAAATLSFDGADAIRLDKGNGWAAVLRAASLASIATAFEQVGGTQACLEMSVAYAKERRVFGQPIGAFQAIKHKLADMYSGLEIARGCAIDAMEAIDGDADALVSFAAMARLGGITAYEFAGREAIQTYGGIGVTWEAAPQHHYRRSRSLALELGGAPFWRELLVNELLATTEGK